MNRAALISWPYISRQLGMRGVSLKSDTGPWMAICDDTDQVRRINPASYLAVSTIAGLSERRS